MIRRSAFISLSVLVVWVGSAFAFFPGFLPSKLPDGYTFTETHGTVIDAETQKPIEGLIVVGMWDLEWTGGPTYMFEGTVSKLIHVEEAITDEKGQFTLAAPPSIKRPQYWAFYGDDPQIIFFKPGYMKEYLSNYSCISVRVNREVYTYSKDRRSCWNDEAIDLEPFRIGSKIPIKDRVYPGKVVILRYVTATQEMWEDYLESIQSIFERIEEADKKKIHGIPIKLAPYIETQKVKNLLKIFAEERKKASKPYYLNLPQRFEDYLKEIGYE